MPLLAWAVGTPSTLQPLPGWRWAGLSLREPEPWGGSCKGLTQPRATFSRNPYQVATPMWQLQQAKGHSTAPWHFSLQLSVHILALFSQMRASVRHVCSLAVAFFLHLLAVSDLPEVMVFIH